MASASHATAGPESVITLKINYDGSTRRAKMFLRDMIPAQLERQVRGFLGISAEEQLVIERYSDSAASYVELEKTNVAVYKQLYRAAKAKSKLKLRVTKPNAHCKTAAPRPVSVEEVPDFSTATQTLQEPPTGSVSSRPEASSSVEPTPTAMQQPAATPGNHIEMTLPLRCARTPDADALAKGARQIAENETLRKDLTQRLENMVDNLSVLTTSASRNPKPSPESPQLPLQGSSTGPARGLAVCCNSCDGNMPDVHYHCSTCDDGDFDLCSRCVDLGITCHSPSHWMIKRTMVNGQIVNSTTEVLPPKPKKAASPKVEEKPKPADAAKPAACFPPPLPACYDSAVANPLLATIQADFAAMRTCNNCIGSFAEKEFLHCTTCEDFDLCKACFARNQHGHHPMHGFTPALAGTEMSSNIKAKLAPGRNQMHHAICDGCDKYIYGVRHKCLDCPDWDYCSTCQPNAHVVHPGHRFVPIMTPLVDAVRVLSVNKTVHQGVCCDGPLCATGKGYPSYIRGIRYKCAVCDDVDFCANCEAHPQLSHNKTHPLIKIRTPIRHINVTTTGEKSDGSPMRPMGDGASIRRSPAPPPAPALDPATLKAWQDKITAINRMIATSQDEEKHVDTSEEVENPPPTDTIHLAEPFISRKSNPSVGKHEVTEQNLRATFIRDTVVDGTNMPPNHVFEQSWVLRNEGPVAWPSGCSVKYVGGDYMGHVDSNHPAEISKLVSASESTVCYDALAPGQEFAFTVLLRTPTRPGKFVSYWRLSTPDGLKFGHRLWCDIVVRADKVEEPKPVVQERTDKTRAPAAAPAPEETPAVAETGESSLASSRMIFPKLEKESPSASMHEPTKAHSTAAPSTIADDRVSSIGAPDESAEDEDWDVSEDGFLTDEEYDILDASDEEFLQK